MDEFGSSPEVIERARKHAAYSGELHTDMHEVIGHASGKINEGVGTTDQTLKNYAGVLKKHAPTWSPCIISTIPNWSRSA